MVLAVVPTAREAAAALADAIVAAIGGKADLVLGLPTGRTAVPFYAALVSRYVAGVADFARVRTFNLDEFCGLEARDRRSYHAFMRRHLFARVNLHPANTHVPDGAARDWRNAARRYDAAIDAAGGLDVCCVGIGENGHLGFNEPRAVLTPRTHRARLASSTRRANAHLFGGRTGAVPAFGLTMGIATILRARAVFLIATGRDKSAIVARALRGPITTRVPASLLQLHPCATAILDRAAAAALR
jgi:glucosamine-6-phosphate deaminase